jgi:L-ribulose-5-phosphate 4-epimerase
VSGRDLETGLVVIKPSGIGYKRMKASDMVVLDTEGKVVEGKYKPSTDLPTHILLYMSFSSQGGVVNTHSTYETSWAQAGRSIPPFGTTHADHFNGEIPFTRILTDEEIANDYEVNTGKVIIEKIGKSDPLSVPSILVNCHGPFCWGVDPESAVYYAIALEENARMAFYTVLLGKKEPVDKALLDKHFKRKHGSSVYSGQDKNKINL